MLLLLMMMMKTSKPIILAALYYDASVYYTILVPLICWRLHCGTTGYTLSQKTSPTFLALTQESIVGFS